MKDTYMQEYINTRYTLIYPASIILWCRRTQEGLHSRRIAHRRGGARSRGGAHSRGIAHRGVAQGGLHIRRGVNSELKCIICTCLEDSREKERETDRE